MSEKSAQEREVAMRYYKDGHKLYRLVRILLFVNVVAAIIHAVLIHYSKVSS